MSCPECLTTTQDPTLGDPALLPDDLTLLLTTSPSPFHPSTVLLSTVLESLHHAPGLAQCPLVVMFDGYRTVGEKRMKQGKVTKELADAYEEYYLAALAFLQTFAHRHPAETYVLTTRTTQLATGATTFTTCITHTLTSTSTCHTPLTMLRFTDSIGFALAVRAGLTTHVRTRYTMVLQHDWAWVHPTPVVAIVGAMKRHAEIKYVTFPSTRSLEYARRRKHNEFPDSVPCGATYAIPLTPLFFFYDRPHVCETEHYKTNVFGRGLFARGDFIEDTYSQILVAAVKAPAKNEDKVKAWEPFGTFLYYAHEGAVRIVRHVNGRNGYLEDGKKDQWIKEGLGKKEQRARKEDDDEEQGVDWEAYLDE
ncbi:hypothetical protein DFJ77DRAFT_548446 [Powellomyces hirtus]|nr:hypothetical protein DFJ77DRAFT_548446 [Powellomyces hirtus]